MAKHFAGPTLRFEARPLRDMPDVAIATTHDIWPCPGDFQKADDGWTLAPPDGEKEWVAFPHEHPVAFQDRVRRDLQENARDDNLIFVHFPNEGFWLRRTKATAAPWI